MPSGYQKQGPDSRKRRAGTVAAVVIPALDRSYRRPQASFGTELVIPAVLFVKRPGSTLSGEEVVSLIPGGRVIFGFFQNSARLFRLWGNNKDGTNVMKKKDPQSILIEKAKEGDRAAFEELVARYRKRLEALVRSRMARYRLANIDPDDILQEVLLRSFRALRHFHWQGEDPFMRWLGAIVENVVLGTVKRLSRHRVLRLDRSVAGPEPSPSKTLRRNERFDRLEASLARLSEEYWTVILLARIEGLSTKEIARRMGRSESSVKNLLLRGLKALRRTFGDTASFGLPDRELGTEEDNHEP